MDPDYFSLIEIMVGFGAFLVFILWQFRSLKRDKAITAEKLARENKASRPPG